MSNTQESKVAVVSATGRGSSPHLLRPTSRKTSPLVVLLIALAMCWTVRAEFKELQAIGNIYTQEAKL